MLNPWLNCAGLPKGAAAVLAALHFAAPRPFGIRPEDRAQSDIDLYCPRETVEAARDALLTAGYRPMAGLEA